MVLSFGLQQNAGVELHMIKMLKQFPLQLGKAVEAASRFDICNLDIINGGPRYCYNQGCHIVLISKICAYFQEQCLTKYECAYF